MKSPSIKSAALSAFVLLSPLLAFAGGQPAKVRMSNPSETADRTGITRALQQGKGSGTMRQEYRGNAYRSETAENAPLLKDNSAVRRVNLGDSAFRK